MLGGTCGKWLRGYIQIITWPSLSLRRLKYILRDMPLHGNSALIHLIVENLV
jgi:hypothetical protein